MSFRIDGEFYTEEDDGLWCVFYTDDDNGGKSGHAYSSYDSEIDAEDDVRNRNEVLAYRKRVHFSVEEITIGELITRITEGLLQMESEEQIVEIANLVLIGKYTRLLDGLVQIDQGEDVT